MAEKSDRGATRIRSFIAVDPSDAVRASLGQLVGELATMGADVRWVREANVHCTLKFLGGVEEERLAAAHLALEHPVSSVAAFAVTARGLGVFPSWSRPRVVWVGLEAPSGAASLLTALAEAVESATVPLGFPREARAFRAHITLGRVRSSKGWSAVADRLRAGQDEDFGAFRVDRVIVYRSELGRDGSRYTPLWTVPLRI